MKLELRIEGKVVVIEAEGVISVQIREDGVPEPEPSGDDSLFARLAALRREIAAGQGVPPYVIFHDKTLREMAETRPADLPALGQLPGIGKAKLDKYGPRFLAIIRDAAE